MKKVLIGFLGILFALPLLSGQPKAADYFWCRDGAERAAAKFSPLADEVAAHRQFTLPTIHYNGRLNLKGGFDFTLLVNAQGKPECISSVGRHDDSKGGASDDTLFHGYDVASTEERIALLMATAKWRYAPFLKSGAPSEALVAEHVNEVVDPGSIAMPQGRLFGTSISLTRSGCLGSCSAYNITIRGDGRVTYSSHDFTDVPGTFTYKISPGEVAALIERLRSRDLWSMRDSYSALLTDSASTTIRIVIGGRKKTVVDYVGRLAGMPDIVTTIENDIDDTSGASDLVNLTARGLALLDQNNFVFKGQAGADLLVHALDDRWSGDDGPRVSDEVINALMDRGPPLVGGQIGSTPDSVRYPLKKTNALDAALVARRESLVPRLIKNGALLTNGKTDPALVNSAFQSAIAGGREAQVETMWTFHPDLIFQSPGEYLLGEQAENTPAPVTLLVYRDGVSNDLWQDFAITRFLLDKGCDINGKDGKGHTLLMAAAQDGDPTFVQWLLDRGADIKPLDKDGHSALTHTYDEATALVLLNAGADPLVEPQYGSSIFVRVQDGDEWAPVVNWLKQHGYDAQLKDAAR